MAIKRNTPPKRDILESGIIKRADEIVSNSKNISPIVKNSLTALKSEIEYRENNQTATTQINQNDINQWTAGPNNLNPDRFINFLQETWDLEIIPQSEAIQNISSNPASNELVQTSVDFIKNQIGRTYIERMWLMIQYIRNRMWIYSDHQEPYDQYIINWPNSAKSIVEKYWGPSDFGGYVRFHPEVLLIGGNVSPTTAIPASLIFTLTLPNASNNPDIVARVYQYPVVAGYTVGQYKVHTCPLTWADNYTSHVGGFPSNRPQLQQYFVQNKQNMDGNPVDAPDTEYFTDITPTGTPNPSGGGGGGNTGGGTSGGFCFVGETLVTMPDITYKRIDEIRVGDIVKSEIGTSKVKR